MLIPLLSSTDPETVTAAVAALRNLSIHKGNEVWNPDSEVWDPDNVVWDPDNVVWDPDNGMGSRQCSMGSRQCGIGSRHPEKVKHLIWGIEK